MEPLKNCDQDEIAKFEAQASAWWDPNGPAAPLHHLNPVRLQFISDRCFLTQKRVLDIGCGAGILTESLAQRGAIATGIDASGALIDAAKQHAINNNTNLTYAQATAESYLEQNQGGFDVITCMELLEHVPDPLSLIKTCSELLSADGVLFLSTLNRTLKSYLFAIVGAEYVLKLLPKHTHEYEKFIRPSELMSWLEASQFSLQEIAGINYNPFTHKAHLSQDVSINYIAYVRKA